MKLFFITTLTCLCFLGFAQNNFYKPKVYKPQSYWECKLNTNNKVETYKFYLYEGGGSGDDWPITSYFLNVDKKGNPIPFVPGTDDWDSIGIRYTLAVVDSRNNVKFMLATREASEAITVMNYPLKRDKSFDSLFTKSLANKEWSAVHSFYVIDKKGKKYGFMNFDSEERIKEQRKIWKTISEIEKLTLPKGLMEGNYN